MIVAVLRIRSFRQKLTMTWGHLGWKFYEHPCRRGPMPTVNDWSEAWGASAWTGWSRWEKSTCGEFCGSGLCITIADARMPVLVREFQKRRLRNS